MKNIILITKREYLTGKEKSFVVLTLMAPILLLLFGAVITYMFKANKTHYNIAVVDNSQSFSKMKNSGDISYQYVSEKVPGQ